MSHDITSTTKPVWMRAVMVREGDDVVTRCCVVTEGQYFPIEVRVNVPQLIASLQQLQKLGLAPEGSDAVSGFGHWLKKAVRKVTHNKIVSAVGKVVSKAVNNPIVQMVLPPVALAKGALNVAKGAVQFAKTGSLSSLGRIGLGALSFVSPQASTALGVGLKAVHTAKLGPAISSVARAAQHEMSVGRSAAHAILEKRGDPKQARALVQRAVNLRSNVQKVAPQLAKHVVASSKMKAVFGDIAVKAKAGSPDALLAARVIARSSLALDQINRLKQAHAGGVAGLLVTSQGRIVAAPKGRFVQRSTAAARPDVLYRGAREATLKGSFAAVSGWGGVGFSPGWGGDTDPGNDIDGPSYRVRNTDGSVLLDDHSQTATAFTP
jgi:hypothetical protein